MVPDVIVFLEPCVDHNLYLFDTIEPLGKVPLTTGIAQYDRFYKSIARLLFYKLNVHRLDS